MRLDITCVVCGQLIGVCETEHDTSEGILSMQKTCGRLICDDCCEGQEVCFECENWAS